MVTLTPSQESLVNQLQHLALSSASHLPSVLLYGPSGVGKRQVVARLADDLGLELVEINASDSATFVASRLCGISPEKSAGESFGGSDGELGRSGEVIVYLSGFENLRDDESFHQLLFRILAKRTYIGVTGDERRVSDGIWIFAAMKESRDPSSQVSVELDHWLCTHFQHHLRLDAPESVEELGVIITGILKEYGCSLEESPAPYLLEMVRDAPDCLRALRRWLAGAARRQTKSGVVSSDSLRRAVISDLKSIFERLRYCGYVLDASRFERWSKQFGDLQSVAVHLLRLIAKAYFVTDQEYFRAIEFLIKRSGIPRRTNVVFCKWQSEGQSGPRVANQVKNRAFWRVQVGSEIDLTHNESEWPVLDKDAHHQLVLVDDFVGSGRTIAKLFVGEAAPVPRLLKKLPNARLWIGIIVGYEAAFREALSTIVECAARVTLTPYKLLTEQDKCFSNTSRIFPNPNTRDRVKEFCMQAAMKHYSGLPKGMRLGFNSTGALVVFHDTVPNNSLPIIWHNEGSWFPLFPASGLPSPPSADDEDLSS